jgi:hypothetical protein
LGEVAAAEALAREVEKIESYERKSGRCKLKPSLD